MVRRSFSLGLVMLGAALLVLSAARTEGDEAAAPQPRELPPVEAPDGAVVLFDGTATDAWRGDRGEEFPWRLADDYFEVRPGSGSCFTRGQWGDMQYHMQFATPYMPEATGQGRGNSGLYFPGDVEVQILDSYGLVPQMGDCGALYGIKIPDHNACLPPEVWQTYDVTYTAPKFDQEGRKIANPRFTVVHNGVVIHDDVEVDRDWRPNAPGNTFVGRILLQDHGNRVRFRNIWVKPL